MSIVSKEGMFDFTEMINMLPPIWREPVTQRIEQSDHDIEGINIITDAIEKISSIFLLEKKYDGYKVYINAYNSIVDDIREHFGKMLYKEDLGFSIKFLSKIKSIHNYLQNFRKNKLCNKLLLMEHIEMALDQAINCDFPIEDFRSRYSIGEDLKADIVIFGEKEIIITELKKGALQRKDLYQVYDYAYLLKEKYPDKSIKKLLICGSNQINNKLILDLKISTYIYEVKSFLPLQIKFTHNIGDKIFIMDEIDEYGFYPGGKIGSFIEQYVANKLANEGKH